MKIELFLIIVFDEFKNNCFLIKGFINQVINKVTKNNLNFMICNIFF